MKFYRRAAASLVFFRLISGRSHYGSATSPSGFFRRSRNHRSPGLSSLDTTSAIMSTFAAAAAPFYTTARLRIQESPLILTLPWWLPIF